MTPPVSRPVFRPLPGLLLAAAAGLLLGGCAELPPVPALPSPDAPAQFQGPAAPLAAAPAPDPAPALCAADPCDWWQAMGDPQLDALVAQALAHNTDLAQAQARLAQARAQTGQAEAARLPSLTLDPQATRTKTSQNLGSGLVVSGSSPALSDLSIQRAPYTTRLSLPLNAAYEVDLWDRLAQAEQATLRQAQASAEDWRSAQLSISAAVVSGYVQLRTHQAQLALLEEDLQLRGDTLRTRQAQQASGRGEASAVDAAEQQLLSARSQQAQWQASVAQDLNALAQLCGAQPGALASLQPAAPGALGLQPPPTPPELPSEVLLRRPDVRRELARLQAQQAHADAVRSERFPRLRLSTSLGYESESLSQLLSPGSALWQLAASLSQSVFDGGRQQTSYAQARAEFDEAAARYQGTVIQALREVEDALQTLAASRSQHAAAQASSQAGERMAQRAQAKWRAGLDSRNAWLEARHNSLQQQLAQQQWQGQTLMAYISLRKALGE